jgi:hypothetical protein
MTKREPVELPVLRGREGGGAPSRPPEPSGPPLGGSPLWGIGVPANPARIEAGWELRFVAEGSRAEEMIALYRELGFEVAADPVPSELLATGCAECFTDTRLDHRSIYTRLPRAPGADDDEE